MRLRIRTEFGAGRVQALARRTAAAAVLRAVRRREKEPREAADGDSGTDRAARLPATSRLGPVLARWADEEGGGGGGAT